MWYTQKKKICDHLLNKPCVNGVSLRVQNPPLKCCKPLDFLCAFLKGLDLLMLKIWSLLVKGLQSYRPSNFKNDSTPDVLKCGPSGVSGAGARR